MNRLLCLFICLTNVAQAEISINNEQLSINNGLYDISQDLGQTVGGNLFHTFDSFNVSQNEIAQFSGSDSIQNIISRVIGGEASFINGTIRSTIPNADFYFLNPYGIVFGEHARLDLQGSFHASTADYLKLSDGGEFHARFPERDILTVAPIESFGFLSDTAAAIQLTDAQLAVAPMKMLSLVGGDIRLTNTMPTIYDEASQHQFTHQLVAPSGQIILDSKGGIQLNNFGVDASGLFGGQITIRGKNLTLNSSRISSHTIGEMNGQTIDIKVNNLTLHDADIVADTYAQGDGNHIHVNVTDTLTATYINRPAGIVYDAFVAGGSHIGTATAGLDIIGNSGNVHIQANSIDLTLGGNIHTYSFSAGKAGDIHIQSPVRVWALGILPLDPRQLQTTQAYLPVSGIRSMGFAHGDIGHITLHTGHLLLANGGQVNASIYGGGKGGNISLQADESIEIKSQEPLAGSPSTISSTSFGFERAGFVKVQTQQLTLEEGGTISTSVLSQGDANVLTVMVSDTLTISGVSQRPFVAEGSGLPFPSNISSASGAVSADAGEASNLYIQAKHIRLENGGVISSLTFGGGDGGNADIVADTLSIIGWQNNGRIWRSGINNSSSNPTAYAGYAGNIQVTANQLLLQDQGTINTSAVNGGGGDIKLNVRDTLYLFDQGSITTSVQGGGGDGGNITVGSPQFLVMNHSPIIAQAYEGHGGNIDIITGNYLKSSNSIVDASSQFGVSGVIQIDSPEALINEAIATLSEAFLKIDADFQPSCESNTSSHFSVVPKLGISNQSYDWISAH